MKKKEMLTHWAGLTDNTADNIAMNAVPYKHEGSTYDQDGIRLTGTRTFIDAVLAVLKPLLRYENGTSRLQVVYKQSTDRNTGVMMDTYNCYIQVHERGEQAQMVNAFLAGATRRK